MRFPRLTCAFVCVVASLVSSLSAQGPYDDLDLDGYTDGLESFVGSDPAQAGSIPESLLMSVGLPVSRCLDGIDNDLDGFVDADDSGCTNTPTRDLLGCREAPCP